MKKFRNLLVALLVVFITGFAGQAMRQQEDRVQKIIFKSDQGDVYEVTSQKEIDTCLEYMQVAIPFEEGFGDDCEVSAELPRRVTDVHLVRDIVKILVGDSTPQFKAFVEKHSSKDNDLVQISQLAYYFDIELLKDALFEHFISCDACDLMQVYDFLPHQLTRKVVGFWSAISKGNDLIKSSGKAWVVNNMLKAPNYIDNICVDFKEQALWRAVDNIARGTTEEKVALMMLDTPVFMEGIRSTAIELVLQKAVMIGPKATQLAFRVVSDYGLNFSLLNDSEKGEIFEGSTANPGWIGIVLVMLEDVDFVRSVPANHRAWGFVNTVNKGLKYVVEKMLDIPGYMDGIDGEEKQEMIKVAREKGWGDILAGL